MPITTMDPQEIRRQRTELGYSVTMLAELLRVEPRLVSEWENGATPVPDWLSLSMNALMKSRSKSQDDLLIANGTFASRRRTLLRSKPRG
jgi:DNA-binding transcriptional regulator YiaG